MDAFIEDPPTLVADVLLRADLRVWPRIHRVSQTPPAKKESNKVKETLLGGCHGRSMRLQDSA